MQFAQDIAITVNDQDNLRVLPIAGDGAVGNVRDILMLRGVDLGITSVQVLNGLKASGEHGPNLEKRIAYIAQAVPGILFEATRQQAPHGRGSRWGKLCPIGWAFQDRRD